MTIGISYLFKKTSSSCRTRYQNQPDVTIFVKLLLTTSFSLFSGMVLAARSMMSPALAARSAAAFSPLLWNDFTNFDISLRPKQNKNVKVLLSS